MKDQLLVIVALLVAVKNSQCYKYKPKQERCERIVIPLCSDIPYNYTRMPNLLGHSTQQEAAAQVHEFIPLVQIGCSRLLKFFLCSEYAPMCTEQVDETLVIPPCRSMCLEVRSRCEPILQRFNFHWPVALDCDVLPVRSDRIDLCIELPGTDDWFPTDDIDGQQQQQHLLRPPITRQDVDEERSEWIRLVDGADPDVAEKDKGATRLERLPVSHAPGDKTGLYSAERCAEGYISTTPVDLVRKTPPDVTHVCVQRCHGDVMFREEDKHFANTWLITWSTISFVSSLLTVLTFAIDRSRFRYPERPIVYICVCSALHAVAYLVRVCAGRSLVSCDHTTTHLVHGDLSNVWCITIAILLYYFSTAGAIWWAVLTISWYLATARKWGEEAMWTLAKYFHLVSWGLPAVCTITAIILRKVDADELTGLCYIGSSSPAAVSSAGETTSSITDPVCFVVLPLVTCLAVGTGFVGAGFGAVRRVRHALQQHQWHKGGLLGIVSLNGVDRLERLMVKIAVFSTLYAVPIATVLGCVLYEAHGSARWHYSAARRLPCSQVTTTSSPDGTSPSQSTVDDCRLDESIPSVEVFLVKTFASLMPGIGGGVYIWSMKTIRSWREFFVQCVPSTAARRRGTRQSASAGASEPGGNRSRSLAGRMVRWPGGLVTSPPSSPTSPAAVAYSAGQLFTLN